MEQKQSSYKHKFEVGDIVKAGNQYFRVYNIRITTFPKDEPKIEYNVRPPKESASPIMYDESALILIARYKNCEDFTFDMDRN